MSALPRTDVDLITGRLSNYTRYIFEAINKKPFLWNSHHAAICNALERVFLGQCPRLVINIAPRYSKTQLAVLNFVSWSMGIYPDSEFIHASYAASLAEKNSYYTRAIMRSVEYQELFPDVSLSDDSKSVSDWKTTEGGVFCARGTDGIITGFGAGNKTIRFGGALIIDDPSKSIEARRSQVARQKVIDWFKSTVENRLNSPDTPIIVIMQRLHEEDLAGWLLDGGNGEQWEHLCFETLRPDGTALWPEMHSIDQLHRMQKASPYDFAGQYQQRPIPLEGGLIKHKWLNYFTTPPAFKKVIASWDTAGKADRELNAPSVCTIWGQTATGYYLLDVFRDWLEFPDLERAAESMQQKWRCNAVLIEDKSSGQGLIQSLRRNTRMPIIPVKPDGVGKGVDAKYERMERNTPKFEGGLIHIREGQGWTADYVNEITTYPASKFADQLDSTSQALDYLGTNSGGGYATAGSRAMR